MGRPLIAQADRNFNAPARQERKGQNGTLFEATKTIMEETKRQKQVGQLVQEEMSDIFLREGLTMAGGGMVSISKVSLTPDLMEARVQLSLFQVAKPEELLKDIRDRTPELRNQLGRRVKNQLRRVPELSFFIDDSLERAFKMEALFDQIRKEREGRETDKQDEAS